MPTSFDIAATAVFSGLAGYAAAIELLTASKVVRIFGRRQCITLQDLPEAPEAAHCEGQPGHDHQNSDYIGRPLRPAELTHLAQMQERHCLLGLLVFPDARTDQNDSDPEKGNVAVLYSDRGNGSGAADHGYRFVPLVDLDLIEKSRHAKALSKRGEA